MAGTIGTSTPSVDDLQENLGAIDTSGQGGLGDGVEEVQNNIELIQEMLPNVTLNFWEAILSITRSVDKTTKATLNEFRQNFSKTLADSIGGLDQFSEADEDAKKNPKDKPMAGTVTISDLKGLPMSMVGGSVLIAGILSDILTVLQDKKGKDKESGGVSGIKGLFGGLMKGLGGIGQLAVGLMAFAGAAVLFNFVDWGKALFGMAMFSAFVIGAVLVTRLLRKDQENLEQFGKMSFYLAAGLGVFSLSIILAAKTKDYVVEALPVIGMYVLFLVGIGVVSRAMTSAQKDMLQFGKMSLMLSGALALFSVALIVAAYAKDYIVDAIPALGLFIGFLLVFAVVGAACKSVMSAITSLAIVSVGMTLSLGLFGGMLMFLGTQLVPILPQALLGVGVVAALIVALAALGMLFTLPMLFAGALLMSTFSILISTGFIMFGAAMLVAANLPKGGFLGMMAACGSIVLVAAAMAMVVVPLTVGLVGAALLVPFATLILAGFSVFALADAAVSKFKMAPMIKAMATLGILVTAIAALTPVFIVGSIAAAFFTTFAVVASAGFIAMGAAFHVLASVPDDISQKSRDFAAAVTTVIGGLPTIGIKDVLNIAKFTPIAIALGGAFASMGQVFETLGKTSGLSKEVLQSQMSVLGEVLSGVVSELAVIANKMSSDSAKAMKALSKSILPITDGMKNIVDTIVNLTRIDQSQISGATDTLKLIMNNLFDGGPNSLAVVFTHIAEVGTSKLKGSAKKLRPAIEAVDSLIDLVSKIERSGLAGKSLGGGLAPITEVAVFCGELGNIEINVARLKKAKQSFEILGDMAELIKPFAESSDLVNFMEVANRIGGFQGVSTFDKNITAVGKGMKKLSDSLENVRMAQLNAVTEALKSLSSAAPMSIIEPFVMLSSQADGIRELADQMARLAVETERVNKANSVITTTSGLNARNIAANGEQETKVNHAIGGAVDEETSLQTLVDLLQSVISTKGLRVYADNGQRSAISRSDDTSGQGIFSKAGNALGNAWSAFKGLF